MWCNLSTRCLTLTLTLTLTLYTVPLLILPEPKSHAFSALSSSYDESVSI